MEKLTQLTTESFTELLASDAPAPGGGSASALAAALGAALSGMVSELTLGKEKYAENAPLAESVREKALVLQKDLLTAVDKDTEAFNKVSAAFGMPKSTDEEKAARSAAIQEGLVACIESPLNVMDLCLQALRLTRRLVGHSNESAASDLGVSALMLEAGLKGAWLNVKINLGSLKDKEKAADYETRAKIILEEAAALAEETYLAIEASL